MQTSTVLRDPDRNRRGDPRNKSTTNYRRNSHQRHDLIIPRSQADPNLGADSDPMGADSNLGAGLGADVVYVCVCVCM